LLNEEFGLIVVANNTVQKEQIKVSELTNSDLRIGLTNPNYKVKGFTISFDCALCCFDDKEYKGNFVSKKDPFLLRARSGYVLHVSVVISDNAKAFNLPIKKFTLID
jgi:hypothetical protein